MSRGLGDVYKRQGYTITRAAQPSAGLTGMPRLSISQVTSRLRSLRSGYGTLYYGLGMGDEGWGMGDGGWGMGDGGFRTGGGGFRIGGWRNTKKGVAKPGKVTFCHFRGGPKKWSKRSQKPIKKMSIFRFSRGYQGSEKRGPKYPPQTPPSRPPL